MGSQEPPLDNRMIFYSLGTNNNLVKKIISKYSNNALHVDFAFHV